MDRVTPEARSRIMAAIRSRDTRPELVVRRWLYAQGYRYRCQYGNVPGHPDVAIPRLRTLIEVRGCFWHRHAHCADATVPKSNTAFWNAKFRANVARDARHEREWARAGWNLIVIWTCGLKTAADRAATFRRVGRWLGEIAGTQERIRGKNARGRRKAQT